MQTSAPYQYPDEISLSLSIFFCEKVSSEQHTSATRPLPRVNAAAPASPTGAPPRWRRSRVPLHYHPASVERLQRWLAAAPAPYPPYPPWRRAPRPMCRFGGRVFPSAPRMPPPLPAGLRSGCPPGPCSWSGRSSPSARAAHRVLFRVGKHSPVQVPVTCKLQYRKIGVGTR